MKEIKKEKEEVEKGNRKKEGNCRYQATVPLH